MKQFPPGRYTYLDFHERLLEMYPDKRLIGLGMYNVEVVGIPHSMQIFTMGWSAGPTPQIVKSLDFWIIRDCTFDFCTFRALRNDFETPDDHMLLIEEELKRRGNGHQEATT